MTEPQVLDNDQSINNLDNKRVLCLKLISYIIIAYFTCDNKIILTTIITMFILITLHNAKVVKISKVFLILIPIFMIIFGFLFPKHMENFRNFGNVDFGFTFYLANSYYAYEPMIRFWL
ncbi:hypothetical protein Hokovirus_1_313 [Hokovirus HKV1]|uniref:Uncharacterized protein n=1 Tax=Hokovirus HKV1 TaxID=1977638 RepID=A0A1V0SFL5_9VIRU|nr:hypothetical protein Hokovirus_1_313 [Hokovirus HKV1]